MALARPIAFNSIPVIPLMEFYFALAKLILV